jgi:FkbM family methyltransferase
MSFAKYQRAVDAFAPPIGRLYRFVRDITTRRHFLDTKYGFSLAGDPTVAMDDWESDERKTFLEILDTHDVVLDIGANVGFYTCLAASRGKHTIAFEPSSRNLNFLYKNLWQNQFSHVEVFPLGLAKQPGLGQMFGFDTVTSFVPGWAHADQARFSVVPLTTLDTVAAGRFEGKKLFIKMDVEGFELDVLAGAVETLDRNPKPTWLVEILLRSDAIPGGINRHFNEIFELFWRHGYQCQTPDSARIQVGQADVSRWMTEGSVGRETRDFLFSGD